MAKCLTKTNKTPGSLPGVIIVITVVMVCDLVEVLRWCDDVDGVVFNGGCGEVVVWWLW